MENIALLEFEKNPNIGLYCFVNDKFILCKEDISKKKQDEIEKILKVPLYKISILGTELIGVFISGNNEKIIIPRIFEEEYVVLEKICKKHEIEIITIKSPINTFGNLLTFYKKKIISSNLLNKKTLNEIQKKTNCEIEIFEDENYEIPGALFREAKSKLFVSQNINQKELTQLKNYISGIGTVNSGSNFISSGILCNKNGILIGSISSTIEIQNILESLDFL